jgi:dolichol-phosphate mannosyltransferase
MELSIVSTIYNDAEIVPILVEKIRDAVIPLNIQYEIILVNDCSPDESEQAIAFVCEKYSNVRGITLSRNFGQQIAMTAGMHHAKGNFVVVMDGDLQNPPASIPVLLEKIKTGYDIVYTVSYERNSWKDKVSSRFFWYFLSKILKVKVVPNQLMMKIMTRKFVQQFSAYNEINRSISGIIADIGMKYAVLQVENNKRTIGKSNYNFFKRMNLMIDIVISFSNAPLNFIIYLGLFILMASCILGARDLYLYFFENVPEGFMTIHFTQYFFGSINVLLFGLIGRYLSNIYTEVRRRPIYIISKKHNLE